MRGVEWRGVDGKSGLIRRDAGWSVIAVYIYTWYIYTWYSTHGTYTHAGWSVTAVQLCVADGPLSMHAYAEYAIFMHGLFIDCLLMHGLYIDCLLMHCLFEYNIRDYTS